jgi:HNH endonuclease
MKRGEKYKQDLTHILELYEQGCNIKTIAKKLGHSRDTISMWLKAEGVVIKKRRKPIVTASGGYLYKYVPEHPNANCLGYVALHTLAASKALGRPLKKDEVVHHINGDKTDNRNCNLLVCDRAYHEFLHNRMSELYQKEHFKEMIGA